MERLSWATPQESSQMYEDIKNKRILVVGASRGIGRQLCHALQQFGGHVLAASRCLEALSIGLKRTGILSEQLFACDIQETESISELVKNLDPVDAVCITAGTTKLVPKHMIKRPIIDNQFSVNLSGPIDLISTMFRFKKIKSGASIITTTASGRYNGVKATIPYVAAKNGLVAVSRSLSSELSSQGIRINSVSFDYVATGMTESIIDNFEKNKTDDLDGIVGVSPVENTVIPYFYLISDTSKWMTGQVLSADAGRRLSRVVYG